MALGAGTSQLTQRGFELGAGGGGCEERRSERPVGAFQARTRMKQPYSDAALGANETTNGSSRKGR